MFEKMKSKRTKATNISPKVKQKVWERDQGRCVICGNNYNVMPNSHFIRRSQGGLGIEQNVFTACTNFTPNKCHTRWGTLPIEASPSPRNNRIGREIVCL